MKCRHEYKHQINASDMLQLKMRLSKLLCHDPHCDADGTYIVKSLYFDNYMDKALRKKTDGVRNREKFRIRYYGTDTGFLRLEKKSKINGLCSKESVRITAEKCRKILCGDTAFLLESEENLLRELYAKMQYQILRPRCIVVYRRESFVYSAGNVRVTLDSEISGSSSVERFLEPELQCAHLFPGAILEVKWDEYLPEIIRDAVQVKSRRASAFSKYAAVRI